jgi:hypothetical protein
MKKLPTALAGIILIAAGLQFSFAGGFLSNFSILCGFIFCDYFYIAGAGGLGTGTCISTIPAGPLDWTGKESSPWDTNLTPTGGQQTVKAFGVAFGAGALLDITSPATAVIPGGTPWYFLDGAQGSAFTITMPAAPVGGHIQRIVCESATVGALTIAANTGQTLKDAPTPAGCPATATGFAWVYNQTLATWFRFQ